MTSPPPAQDSFDLVVVGTGFASTFFLHRWLERAAPTARVLVIERGADRSHDWHLEHREDLGDRAAALFDNRTPDKEWIFTVAFGGGSNCWWACTPRMLPEDFELRTRYGVGRDWPFRYDDLEPYYCTAETLMSIAGDDASPAPRSRPYPLPAHRLNAVDEHLRRAYPGLLVPQPTARASRDVAGGRIRCCANGVCSACPVDAKFTIRNGLMSPYRDGRVTLWTDAQVLAVDIEGGLAQGVWVRTADGADHRPRGELVVLGANGLFNPELLLRSGITHPQLGRGLVEQVGVGVDVMLDGIDCFGGSTSITGHGYMLYAGAHRADHAAGLMELYNVPQLGLRRERGRWRQRVFVKVIYEDLRQDANRVELGDTPGRPVVTFAGRSDYAVRAVRRTAADLERVLSPLPTDSIEVLGAASTESHVLGTVVMGRDPADSVVDADLVAHQVRNLVVAGGSAFPTAAPANPSLTISALSLRAADRLS